ncbi:MAG: hypothetical protein OEZ25_08435 [Candidatus Bathyarchaeota archaeon]|nr:hypothetical protein [Candidatus Bathyarchaeota archaeon]
MVKKKKRPNHAVKACPKPPGMHVPYAGALMTKKKLTLPTAMSILIGIGWLIFILLFNFIWLIWVFDISFFQGIIITLVSLLVTGLLIGLTGRVWSFRAGESNGRPIVGGILVIVASCVSFINSSITLVASHQGLSWTPPPTGATLTYFQTLLVIGFFTSIGFALGLVAGIQSLRRKQFRFAMLGISLLMFAGISNFLNAFALPWPVWTYQRAAFGFLFGVPIIGLAFLGLVCVATGKQEFARPKVFEKV